MTVVRNRSFVSSVIKAKLQISLDSQVCTTVAMPMFNCSLYVFKNAQQVQSLHFVLEALPGVCECMSKMFAALFCVFFGLLSATVVLCGCCVCCVCMLLLFCFYYTHTQTHIHTYTHINISHIHIQTNTHCAMVVVGSVSHLSIIFFGLLSAAVVLWI